MLSDNSQFRNLDNSSSGWIRFTRGDCPVCGGERKDCRQSSETKLIHCRSTTANPIDYIERGTDRQGFTMWVYKPDAEAWTDEKRQERIAEKERNEAKRRIKAVERDKRSLTEAERDIEYRKIISALPLTKEDRKSLHARGLTDEDIEVAGFRSIGRHQVLAKKAPLNLPGVNQYGSGLTNSEKGILCPIPNEFGQIAGCQIRASEDIKGGRYRWLSEDNSVNLKGLNERPLAIFGVKQSEMVGLAEGAAFKPLLASLRLGIPVIGAAGGDFAGSPKLLKRYLEHCKAKKVRLFGDGEAVSNRNVLSQYIKTIALLKSWGYAVEVAWWGQIEKRTRDPYLGDIDEICDSAISKIQYLTPDEFLGLCDKSILDKIAAYRSYTQWTRLDRKQQSRSGILADGTDIADYLSTSLIDPKTIYYKPEDRDSLIRKLVRDGYTNILIADNTGSGKSHSVTSITANSLGLDALLYTAKTYKNPSIDKIASKYVPKYPRHNGYVEDGSKIRAAKAGESPTIPSNCHWATKHEQSRKLAPLAATSSLCGKCPIKKLCESGSGVDDKGRSYGFLAQSKSVLGMEHVRLDQASLPSQASYLRNRGAIWEEGITLTVSQKGNLGDIDLLLDKLPIQTELDLTPIKTTLLDRSKKTEGKRYGERIELPKIDNKDATEKLIRAIEKVVERSIEGLAEDDGCQVKNTCLANLLAIASGLRQGSVSIHGDRIDVTLLDTELIEKLPKLGANIILSATADIGILKQFLPDLVVIKAYSAPLTNLTIKSTLLSGSDSKCNLIAEDRKEHNRANAIVHLREQQYGDKLGLIGHRAAGFNYYFGNHDIGSNAFQDCQYLLAVGEAKPNRGALLREFEALTGRLEGFDVFYQSRLVQNMIQLVGRLRANRRTSEEVTLESINFSLPWALVAKMVGANFSQTNAVLECKEAATCTQSVRIRILEAVADLESVSTPVTQKAIGELVGINQSGVSRHIKDLNNC
jgi:hypothetical protein